MRIIQIGLDKTTLEFLRERGIVVEESGSINNVEELEDWLATGSVEAIAVNLAHGNFGIYVARHLRNKRIDTPVVGISLGSPDRSWPEERAIFLEQGGDDLLRGPANPRELNASLFAVSRRYHGSAMSIVETEIGEVHFKVNLSTRSILINNREPVFTHTEQEIVLSFAANPGRALSKDALMNCLYALRADDAPDPKIIDIFVHKVRKKMGEIHPDASKLIETVWGQGYRLVPQPTAEKAVSAA